MGCGERCCGGTLPPCGHRDARFACATHSRRRVTLPTRYRSAFSGVVWWLRRGGWCRGWCVVQVVALTTLCSLEGCPPAERSAALDQAVAAMPAVDKECRAEVRAAASYWGVLPAVPPRGDPVTCGAPGAAAGMPVCGGCSGCVRGRVCADVLQCIAGVHACVYRCAIVRVCVRVSNGWCATLLPPPPLSPPPHPTRVRITPSGRGRQRWCCDRRCAGWQGRRCPSRRGCQKGRAGGGC